MTSTSISNLRDRDQPWRPSQVVVIRDGSVVDWKNHRETPADILVVGDTIREIGPRGMLAPSDAFVINASGKALIPGLVNSHTHSQGNLAKALGDRWNLELLLNAGPWFYAGRTLEDKYLSAKIGAVEMVRRGCTACYDLFAEPPVPTLEGMQAVGQAYADVGMRAVLAPMMADRTFYRAIPGLLDALPQDLRSRLVGIQASPRTALLSVCEQLLRNWPFDRSRIAPALAPTIPLLCSDEFTSACRRLAEQYDVRLHTHMAESRVWAEAGLRTYGKTLTAYFDDLGMLGPRFTAAHAVWIDSEDIRRLSDRGASVAHNPSSNLRLGSGLADVRRMLRAGVNVGLGTDAANCGDHLNMFEAMRLASYIYRVQDYDYSDWLTTDDAMNMATQGSARALGFDNSLGAIAPGYKADLVFLSRDDISFVPLNDITHQIVHSADSSAVHSVMIGGRMIMDGGRFSTLDYDQLVREAEAAIERLRAQQFEAKQLALLLERHVGTFCSGIAREHRRRVPHETRPT
jgi:guanine deaminase